MKIVLVGYGNMGRQIEELIQTGGQHEIVHVAYRDMDDKLTVDHLRGADVAIDFSHGSLMQRHIKLYCQAKVNAVIGTTNWDSRDEAIATQIEAAGIGVVVGSNFSAGVQTFIQIVRLAARQFDRIGGYDVYGHELHHTGKADSPSGTAKTIVETVLAETSAKRQANYDRMDGKIAEDILHFASIRGGVHSGLHEITFDSDADGITLTHNAHNRKGFAAGAIAAADYACQHKGLVRYEELFMEGGPYSA